MIILIISLISIIVLIIFFRNREYFESLDIEGKIISNTHFNGTYLNDNKIITRLNNYNNKHLHKIDSDRLSDFVIYNTKHNCEDPRIFKTNSKEFPNIVVYTEYDDINRKHIGLFASLINNKEETVNKIRLYDPENKDSIQKNWILINSNDLENTHWIMWFGPKFVVMRVNMVTGELKHGWTTKGIKDIRGGTPFFEYNGRLFGLCHISIDFPRQIVNKIIELELNPPYKIIGESKPFTFTKNPKYEYACGIKLVNNKVYVLVGLDDKQLVEFQISINDFLSKIKKVEL